jgi:hypothetical protein
MPTVYRPLPGQVAMVQRDDGDPEARPLTGIVLAIGDGPVAVDVGPGGAHLEGFDVVVSVCAADAMYRLRGMARLDDRGAVMLDPLHGVEKVQRRRSHRRPLRMGVTLVPTTETAIDPARVAGRSVDVGPGGVQVETVVPLPADADPVAIMSFPVGSPLMVKTRVVASEVAYERCRYRLVFTDLRPSDADRLALLLAASETVDL